MPTVFIHIGAGKTGTTAIQKMLAANQRELLKQGWLYPIKPELDDHDLVTWKGGAAFERDAARFAALVEAMEAKEQCTAALISSETMIGLPTGYIRPMVAAFHRHPVKIIAYVRRQLPHITSHFLEKQKSPSRASGGSVREFFHRYRDTYGSEHRMLDNWAEVVGDRNLIVRIYDRSVLKEGDIRSDFITATGLPRLQLPDGNNANPSLDPIFSALITAFDQAFPQLLDQQTRYFLVRQRLIVRTLLNLSREAKPAAKADAEAIARSLRKLLGILSLLLKPADRSKIAVIEQEIGVIERKLKNAEPTQLIDEQLRQEILGYYRESNLRFAERYLDAEARDAFLRDYPAEQSSIAS